MSHNMIRDSINRRAVARQIIQSYFQKRKKTSLVMTRRGISNHFLFLNRSNLFVYKFGII